MKVTTDHKWRNFRYRNEVPPKVLASEFDWTDSDDGFFRYRGRWYHIDNFEYCASIPGFDGIMNDSFYSGVAIKMSADGEQYRVATFIA